MTDTKTYLVYDYETRSEAELKDVGGEEYARHPTTVPRCVSWRLGTRETLRKNTTKTWALHRPSPYGELIRALLDPAVVKVAHNAAFEQAITRFALTRIVNRPGLSSIPPEEFLCTASLAAALALPRKLGDVCEVLKLPVQKDTAGTRLISKYCKPQKLTKKMREAIDAGLGLPEHAEACGLEGHYWDNDPEGLDRLAHYCAVDVDAEVELFLRLPELTPDERKVWLLDQRMNQRGVFVDRPAVQTVLRMIDDEVKALDAETAELTGGEIESTNRRAAVLEWLERNGTAMPDLQAKTVADTLASGLVDGPAKRLLEIRQAASKTSTAKYEALEARTRSDSRLRDILLYHGANTGRFSGAGAQVHNFPRGKLKNTDAAIDDVISTGDLAWTRALLGDPMEAFSSCLRGMLTATPGRELFAGDYAAIEVRVLFWIAKHESGLRIFREGRDPYKEIATAIYNVELADVTKPQREVGKRAILGSGYGMGWRKFQQTCSQFGVDVSEELAATAVNAYRNVHAPVPKLWSNLEKAVIAAAQNPGKAYVVNRTKWFTSDGFLFCELPSGRRLAYFGPEIEFEPTPWGDKRPRLYYHYVDPVTKKWTRGATYGGALTENVVQAVARDLMCAAMLRVEAAGYTVLITVHDEILAERDRGTGSVEDFERLMREAPAWAGDCPINVEAWTGLRYRK